MNEVDSAELRRQIKCASTDRDKLCLGRSGSAGSCPALAGRWLFCLGACRCSSSGLLPVAGTHFAPQHAAPHFSPSTRLLPLFPSKSPDLPSFDLFESFHSSRFLLITTSAFLTSPISTVLERGILTSNSLSTYIAFIHSFEALQRVNPFVPLQRHSQLSIPTRHL